ncbi:MAG: hypothetical protein PVH88_22575 [Ignavibacteria bacterium]|jgi:hypothetical protein
MILRTFIIPVLISILLMEPGLILAQSEKQLTLKELCEYSDEIVVGKVVDKISYRSLDGKHVYTNVEIKMEEIIHGKFKKGETLIKKVYGGTIDGKTVYIVGAPNYNVGTSSVFFFAEWKSKNDTSMIIVGNSQGKFDISEDKTGARNIKRTDYNPIIYEENSGRHIDFSSNKTRLEDFKAKIKNYLQ